MQSSTLGSRRHGSGAILLAGACCAVLAGRAFAISDSTTAHFDSDPGWLGRLNRLTPANPPIVTQDFGFSPTTMAGGSTGELGGTISRTITPAWYAAPIATKTLNDSLIASGRISMPPQSSGGGFHFGWFNSQQQGWRPWSQLGFRLDGRGSYANVLVDVMTQTWRAAGVNAGTLPTPLTIPFDGSDHTWQLSYNPSGNGTISFVLDSLPAATLPLPAGFKVDGASFNRFGLLNQQTPSGAMQVYVDNVQYNGVTQNFDSSSTGWEQTGNRTSFADPEQRGAHNFGFSNTHYAGGAAGGEVGGIIWRSTPHQEPYYAAPVQIFSLNTPLTATGKVAFRRGASDGGMYFGWFDKTSMENSVDVAPQVASVSNFMGVTIEGPSAVGWYFRPIYASSTGEKRDSQSGPLIYPDLQSHDFTVSYNPAGNNGGGSMFVTLDGITRQFNLIAGDRAAGATFDRFGLFSLSPDGHFAEVYFDDLTFTSTFVPQWIGSSGNWTNAANWSGGIPNGFGAEANLLGTSTAPATVFTDSAVTVGTLRLDNTNTYVLGGTGSLTLAVSSGSAVIDVARGSHKINLPISVASNTTVNVAAGATLRMSDPVTVLAGATLTHLGAGAVIYESLLTIVGANLSFEGAAVVNSLVLESGASATMIAHGANGPSLLRLRDLSLTADATLDLNDNAARLENADPGTMDQVRSLLLSGQLASGTADSSRRLGYCLVPDSVSGADSLLIQFTYAGDANMDGQIDIADLAALASAWQTNGGWTQGDFDYNGFVDISDLGMLAGNWQRGDSGRVSFDIALASLGLPVVPVPEPAAIFLATALLAGLSARHRRVEQSARGCFSEVE